MKKVLKSWGVSRSSRSESEMTQRCYYASAKDSEYYTKDGEEIRLTGRLVSSVNWNFLTQWPERISKHLCRSAILGQHPDILHLSQNCVYAFASPWEISNPATCSVNLKILSWRKGKFHGILGCKCYSSLPTRIDKKRITIHTKSVGVVLETQLKVQLELTDSEMKITHRGSLNRLQPELQCIEQNVHIVGQCKNIFKTVNFVAIQLMKRLLISKTIQDCPHASSIMKLSWR